MPSRLLIVWAALAAFAASSLAVQPRRVSLLVTNGIVLTADANDRVIDRGAVAMPGLINTHTHAPMVLFRGLADDLALMEWLQKYIFPAEAKTVSPEFVRAGTRLAALEMIESGTTTYVDMYYYEEEIARVTNAAGLRGVLGETIIQFPVPDAKTPAEGLERAEAFIKQFKNDPLITPAVAPHAMYTLDGPTLMACRDLAKRYQVPTIIHVAETQDESRTARERHQASPVAYLESLGFLGPGV